MTTEKNASDLFVEALENEGVEVVYGIPGEENLDLLEALRKSKIKLVLNRHEQAGAFMAATYGRMTGKAGVAISTLGPGATNFTTAAAYAQLGGFPLVLITGQKPIKKSKQGRFQIIDVVNMMKPITKYAKQIVDVKMVSNIVREAFKISQEERAGAVNIEFPEDVSAEAVTQDTPKPFAVSKLVYPEVSSKQIKEVADLIKEAKFPVVLLGGACNRNDVVEALTKFFDKTGLPFINTQMAKGAVSEEHNCYIGTAALSAGDYVHEVIDKSDLVVVLGHDPIEKPPYFPKDGQKSVHINYFSADTDNIYNPHIEVIGCLNHAIEKLTLELGECKQDFGYAHKVRDYLKTNLTAHENDNSYPMKPQKIVNDFNKVIGKEGHIALDNGMYKLWFARYYKSYIPNAILLDNALATMGAGLPCAMELARLYPNKKIAAVVGDGGFMMNSQELETAVRLNLNLVVVVLNDNAYGMIRWKQADMGFSDYGLEFNNPNFVKYAESYGAKGHKVEKSEDLAPLLNKCFEEKGVHLVEVEVDYSENEKVFTKELKNKVSL